MSVAEAVDYIAGMRKRERQSWEQTRLLAEIVCKVMTGEGLDMELPWDKERGDVETEEEKQAALTDLRERAKEMEQMMRVKMAREKMVKG